jgi:hypothetical protein
MMDVMCACEGVCAASVWEFGLVEVVCRIGRRCGVRVGSGWMVGMWSVVEL